MPCNSTEQLLVRFDLQWLIKLSATSVYQFRVATEVYEMIRVLTVFGTRPEAIKMAPVVKQLRKHEGVESRICVTAQHREMLDNALKLFGLTPDYDLNIMHDSQSLTDITNNTLTRLPNVYSDFQPDWVLVQGDTTTTFSASLAAFYAKIQVGHVEAGLRTSNVHAPWPEEINRRLTAVIAKLHFAPTVAASLNLQAEGVPEGSICITGNTVIDALHEVVECLQRDVEQTKIMEARFSFLDPKKKLILVTGHRRENFGEGLEHVCYALRRLGQREDVQIVYPVHMNPRVQEPVREILGEHANIVLIAPQEYLPFVYLMSKAYLILTDSGGIQEEGPAIGKPVLVMREVTERPEAVDAGTVRLVGTDQHRIIGEVTHLLDSPTHYDAMACAHSPYGDGKAAERIVARLLNSYRS